MTKKKAKTRSGARALQEQPTLFDTAAPTSLPPGSPSPAHTVADEIRTSPAPEKRPDRISADNAGLLLPQPPPTRCGAMAQVQEAKPPSHKIIVKNTVVRKGMGLKSFEEARDFARSLRLCSEGEWVKYTELNGVPVGIPLRPENTYRQEWKGYEDFLQGSSVKKADINSSLLKAETSAAASQRAGSGKTQPLSHDEILQKLFKPEALEKEKQFERKSRVYNHRF